MLCCVSTESCSVSRLFLSLSPYFTLRCLAKSAYYQLQTFHRHNTSTNTVTQVDHTQQRYSKNLINSLAKYPAEKKRTCQTKQHHFIWSPLQGLLSKSPLHKDGLNIVHCTLLPPRLLWTSLRSQRGCGHSDHVHSCRIQRRNQSPCASGYWQMCSVLSATSQQDEYCNLKAHDWLR